MARAGHRNGEPGHILAGYLAKAGRSQADLAAEIGCSEARISQLIAGRGRPSPELAHAIEQETGVPAAAWFAIDNRKAARC